MSITKEQFEKFNKHFKIIEETIDLSTNIAEFAYEDIEDFKDEPKGDSFFTLTSYDLGDCDVITSIGYFIAEPSIGGSYKKVKQIYVFKDILNFINNEMLNHLNKKGK